MRNPTAFLRQEYEDLVKNELDWKLRILQGPSTPWCKVDGKKVLMFCSNNYLGLSNHPKLKEAAIKAIQTHGAGSGSVRPIAGTMDIHIELEKRLAKFKHADASLVYQTGFAANAGLIPQLVGKEDLIISDELNHGSIIDGVRLSHAERAVYKHSDVADLQRVLEETEKHSPVGDMIADARTNAGLTQERLAWRLNRQQSFVSKIESGAREVEVREFLWIVQRIGVDPIRLLSQLLQCDDFRDLEQRTRGPTAIIDRWNPGVDDWDDYADVPDGDDDDESALGNWRAPPTG